MSTRNAKNHTWSSIKLASRDDGLDLQLFAQHDTREGGEQEINWNNQGSDPRLRSGLGGPLLKLSNLSLTCINAIFLSAS